MLTYRRRSKCAWKAPRPRRPPPPRRRKPAKKSAGRKSAAAAPRPPRTRLKPRGRRLSLRRRKLTPEKVGRARPGATGPPKQRKRQGRLRPSKPPHWIISTLL